MTLTRRVWLEPSRSNSPVCSTRSSFAWPASRQVADLVEEQRAAVRRFEAPRTRASRPCNAPASAPNSSLSSSSDGSAPTLTRTNGPSRIAELAWMISARIFLARAVRAGDQHRHVGARHLRRHLHDSRASRRCDRRCRAGRSARPARRASGRRAACRSRSAVQHRVQLQQVAHGRHQPRVVPRFREVVGGTRLDQLDRGLEIGPRGQQHDGQLRLHARAWHETAGCPRRPTSPRAGNSCPAARGRRRRGQPVRCPPAASPPLSTRAPSSVSSTSSAVRTASLSSMTRIVRPCIPFRLFADSYTVRVATAGDTWAARRAGTSAEARPTTQSTATPPTR